MVDTLQQIKQSLHCSVNNYLQDKLYKVELMTRNKILLYNQYMYSHYIQCLLDNPNKLKALQENTSYLK